MLNVKAIIETLSFENEEFEKEMLEWERDWGKDFHQNPYVITRILNDDDIKALNIDLSELQAAYDAFLAQSVNVTAEEIKSVYLKLKERDENPRGAFDSAGRFYIQDPDITDVRLPSTKYPYSQMNAARTAKFVKALAHKYRCQNLTELEAVAFSK